MGPTEVSRDAIIHSSRQIRQSIAQSNPLPVQCQDVANAMPIKCQSATNHVQIWRQLSANLMSMHCQFCRLQNQSIPNPGPIYLQSVVDPAHRTSVQGQSAIFFCQYDVNQLPMQHQSYVNLVLTWCQSRANLVAIQWISDVNPLPSHDQLANNM